MFKHACGIGLEEILPKVRDSRYQSGRGFDAASAKKKPAGPADATDP
jgi:hypothetical protein